VAELPDPAALAVCDPDKLRKLWQGLGYYSRVANMQKAAQIVCRQYGGQLPADYAALRALPGIGDYTAGAIASIAFGIPAPAVDGNVLRVFARLDNSSADITKPAAKREFTARVLEEMPKERPGPYNEALMELGALVCLPNGAPKCEVCPLAAQCKGRAAGRAEQLPVKTAKPEKTLVPVTAALITGPQGVLLQRRPSKGLLAGLWQPLAFEGTAMTQPELDAALRAIGLCVQWQAPLQSTRHVFTHRIWQISGFCGTAAGPAPEGCVWASRAELNGEYAVPSAFAGIMRQWRPE
jgi:A/G-specific adenine glycosylase